MVRAKFKVSHKTAHLMSISEDGKWVEKEVGTVTLSPCTQGEENKSWAKYTPAGKIELTVDNPPAFAQFALGEEYFIDFSKVTKAE